MGPDALPDPIEVAVAFTKVLERLGIRYLIGGSLASSVHGEPRSTNDIDILADFREGHIQPFVEGVRSEYYVSAPAVREAVRLARYFNVIHMSAGVKVDVFVAGQDPFDHERLRLRERLQMPTQQEAVMYVDTAEHSALRKLEWYRRGGEVSERQWRDVLAIFRIQRARLDRSRLDTWANRLGVSDLLERAWHEVGP